MFDKRQPVLYFLFTFLHSLHSLYSMNDENSKVYSTFFFICLCEFLFFCLISGVSELKFTFDDTEWTFVDVGGQRTERRKWLHCFQDVVAIIYFVALNECTEQTHFTHTIFHFFLFVCLFVCLFVFSQLISHSNIFCFFKTI
jgi:hypothetical protein